MTMSEHSCLLPNNSQRVGDMNLKDTMVMDGLTYSIRRLHMGNIAEHLAKKYGISREQQDYFAFESQQKAANALILSLFDDEIVSKHFYYNRLGNYNDQFPRGDLTLENLASLRPVFDPVCRNF